MKSFTYRAILIPLLLLCVSSPMLSQQVPALQSPQQSGAGNEVRDVEQPVTPPKIKCNGNQVSILASNSTLGSILNEMHKCIGATIDVPDAAASSRIFDELGPGPARQVLDSLLSASGFNYVIGSSMDDPDKIESILVLSRTNESTVVADSDSRNLSPMRRAYLQMKENARPKPPQTDTDTENAGQTGIAAETNSAVPSDNAAKPEGASPSTVAGDSTPPANPVSKAAPTNAADQQITNMQQLFEQRRQMIQQTQAPPPTSQPQ